MKVLSIIFLFWAILAVYSCDDSYGLDSNVIEKDITKELARDTAVYIISQYEMDKFECQIDYYWTIDGSGSPIDSLLILDNWNETEPNIDLIFTEYFQDGETEKIEFAFSAGHDIDPILKTYRIQKPLYIISKIEFTLEELELNQNTEYITLPVFYYYTVLTEPNYGGKKSDLLSSINYMLEDKQEYYELNIEINAVYNHEKDLKAEINMSFSSIISKNNSK